ncbi:helix-turn-helix domain-containing protein [Paenibacillus sp. Leaf72]|uniref:helix-turn-helix domain-containing protein n=1 Tax=Paenibacillus sp. Leaf72 TaxID=1736234 RepID=UPI0007010928|nr:helix-turn-helix transcriptional regulator [Paenibacillus sp. Leaf72]KQN96989.1 hypothetical protein ASF12_23255 [Paenibacillus sp. Leaf72]
MDGNFGEMIYKARIRLGYTITKTATLSGVSHSTISSAEKNSGKPGFDALYKIGVALDLDPHELIDAAPHLDLSKAPPTALIFGESKDVQVIFSRRLRELRVSIGKTQMEMKKKLSITELRYGYMESGREMPDERLLREIAVELNTTKEFLLGKTDDPTRPN